jgi:hypothetical protein
MMILSAVGADLLMVQRRFAIEDVAVEVTGGKGDRDKGT